MHFKYVIVLPLWLVSATPVKEGSNNVEVRGANNGCPVAHGGCDGVCVIREGMIDACRTFADTVVWDFPCGKIDGQQTSCSGVPNADCVAYGDANAQTFCPVKE
ncbi:hypothetical protein PTMSG1_09670 [Pyrenophora teres f. maculata]|nr:hypothetical protein PTMSG1_09670 [Pyrenophora teres f. maculata]